MRYVEGRDLSEIVREEGALGLGRTLFILDQVSSALDAAHEHDLVHRDVKPANVLLVGNTDRVYLTDFGVAKPTTSAGLTRTGFFIGTPDYSAPEQIEGRDVDARTDIYALGAMLYTCLTGFAPYARDTEVAVLQAHLLEPPPKLKDQRPDLPRGLDRVIATAMAKSKEDRYASCGELMEAAEAAAHERSTRPSAAVDSARRRCPAGGRARRSGRDGPGLGHSGRCGSRSRPQPRLRRGRSRQPSRRRPWLRARSNLPRRPPTVHLPSNPPTRQRRRLPLRSRRRTEALGAGSTDGCSSVSSWPR